LGWAEDGNLARSAHASASEELNGYPPQKAVDGQVGSRWSGIPGHNSGVWFELDWDQPVTVAEILVRQYDRYTFEWDVQTWDDGTGKWVDAGHYGKPNVRLAAQVLCPIEPARKTTKVRIANITNGPSFTEVEVYGPEHKHLPVLSLASDSRGDFVGMLCDSLGVQPVAGKKVFMTAEGAGGGWHVETVSDEHGMFFVPMPVGLKGKVKVRSEVSPLQTLDAVDFQSGLTPHGAALTLGAGWRFALNPPVGFEKPGFDDRAWAGIKVPAHWEMEGFRSRDGIGGYRLRFQATKSAGRTFIRFDGVYSGAEVWLNGVPVARHEGGFTPFEADVTEALRSGENVLALKVLEHTNVSDNLDKMSQYADFPLAGIIRKVSLFTVPDRHLDSFEETCTFGSGLKGATVDGVCTVVNRTASPARNTGVFVSLLDGEGNAVAKAIARPQPLGAQGRQGAGFSLAVANPHPWSAEHPYLYTLRFVVREGDMVFQTIDQKIGLRQTEIRGSQILINQVPVKFRGTCHHDSDPLLGRAVTPELTRKDLAMIKEANLNSVRTSHYPPIPELVEEADRMGVYVEDEADFCWVGVSSDLRNTPRIIQLTGELLARDRNHPSVFMWSLCNESEFGYGFERSHEWVRQIDPSRPTGAATSAWLEIATLHNPIAINRIKQNEGLDKPLLFDEAWAPYQGIFGDVDEMWVDPGIRDYFGEPFPEIYKVFMASKVTQGSMIWAWSDDMFCVPNRGLEYGRETTKSHFADDQYALPGRGIVGDAPWGIVDGWRRRKPEFWIIKKLDSPVKIAEQMMDASKPVRLTVTNEYDFTNLSELRGSYLLGKSHGTFTIDVPPHSTREVTIPVTGSGDLLTVTFRDAQGQIVDAYKFPTRRTSLPPGPKGSPLQVWSESVLAGVSTHISGDKFELAFDTSGGYLRRCVFAGRPLALGDPMIHVLPTNAPTTPLPNRNEWQLESMDVVQDGDNRRVVLKGHYPNFAGSYEMTITPGGEITVHAKFTYSGADMLAREVGMSFSVPRDCDVLRWDRVGEWSAYPDDHIGRPVGKAAAFASHPRAVPPTWPWSQDNTPMGTNDFRSTKRHVKTASIAYPDGVGIQVISDGSQAVRAMVETDRITVHVSDWYGGTNVGWGEWITNYGRGKTLKTGDVIESTVRLRLTGGL